MPEICSLPQSLLWAHQPTLNSHRALTWSLHPVPGLSSHCAPFNTLASNLLQRGRVPQLTKRAPGQSKGKMALGWTCNLSSRRERRLLIPMVGHHTGTVPAILTVTWPISGTARADFLCSSIWGFRLNWSSLRTEDLSIPLSLRLPPCQHGVASPHLFKDDQCPRRPFTFNCFILWQALAQPQGLSGSAASAMVSHGLQRAPSSQEQPKGSYFRTTPQGCPLTLWM